MLVYNLPQPLDPMSLITTQPSDAISYALSLHWEEEEDRGGGGGGQVRI